MAEFLDSNSPSGGHVESSDTVIQKLKQTIYAISEKSMKSKSVVWEQFGVVCNEDNYHSVAICCLQAMSCSFPLFRTPNRDLDDEKTQMCH